MADTIATTSTTKETATVVSNASKYDLTQTIASYLDRHLVFPLLEFLQARDIYPEDDILVAKLDMLGNTGMIDFAVDIYKRLNHTDEVPTELKEKRQAVVASLKKLQADAAPLLEIVDNPEVLNKLIEDNMFNAAYLQEKHDISPFTIEALYKFAKFQFDIGNYSGAAEYLTHFRTLSSTTTSPSTEMTQNALWGKFAANILMQNWENALEDLNRLNDQIELTSRSSKLESLHHRTWLIHWALFVFFNHPNGRKGIIDFFLSDVFAAEKNLNTVQLTCPWVLRYLATAVITSKHRRAVMQSLVSVIQREEYEYTDPITELLNCIFVQFDFDAALEKLGECEEMLANDFFLVACQEEFVENAKQLIFETYCRVHKNIDISMISDKLKMEKDAAKTWLETLINNSRMEATYDAENDQMVMINQFEDVHNQVMSRTKVLNSESVRNTTPQNSRPADE